MLTPCSGISDALKTLRFKVYDVKTASDRYERDFPLWLEAARLRQEGQPYNKSDFDKMIGDYDAVVGAPACYFDLDFVKLYPNVKVILVTREASSEMIQRVYKKIKSRFWQRFDPDYYGKLNQFFRLCATDPCINQDSVIRSHVREKNLLEIHNLIAWVPLCEFLGVKVPDAPTHELHDNTTKAELAARPRRAVIEQAKKSSDRICKSLAYIVTTASVILASAVAVVFGGIALYRLSSAGSYLFHFLAARSQIRDTTRLAAASLAMLTFVCGMGAGYSIALMRVPEPIVVDLPPRENRRRNNNGRRNGGKGRDRQSEHTENKRPERPTLDKWAGVQENIRRDDAEKIQEGRATFEEWKNGKHVTFRVTHKRTESGQNLFSGPRKVLSVTEETIE